MVCGEFVSFAFIWVVLRIGIRWVGFLGALLG
jgi:hypothetical protein